MHGTHRLPARQAWLLMPALAATFACGGSGDGGATVTTPGGQSAFSANVTGAVTATLTGAAAYLTDANDFSLVMTTSVGQNAITLLRHTAGVPTAATYTIADMTTGAPAATAFAANFVANGSTQYISRSGTVVVTSVSGGHVKGTFDMQAAQFSAGTTGAAVHITGSFDALTP